MFTSESESISPPAAIRKRGTPVHHGALQCTGKHARAARGIWPRKTAEHWSAAANVKLRIARYWLAGTREVSEAGKLAIIRELS